MKCPFELPVRLNKKGHFVCGDDKSYRDLTPRLSMSLKYKPYIVHAINSHEKLKTALEQIRDLETECCPRCEGNGRLYADGKAHLPSYQGDTIPCGSCGGSGRILPEDAQEIAQQAIKEAEKT